jgi:hypothetical protein
MKKVNSGPVNPRRHSTLPGGSHKMAVIPNAHPSATNGAAHNDRAAKARAVINYVRKQNRARQAAPEPSPGRPPKFGDKV